jgi:hypothetical protein
MLISLSTKHETLHDQSDLWIWFWISIESISRMPPYTDFHYSMKRSAHQNNLSLSFFISYILPCAVRQLFRPAFIFSLLSSRSIAFLSSLLHYCVTLLRPPHCSAYDTLRYTRYGYSCNGTINLRKYLILKIDIKTVFFSLKNWYQNGAFL